MMATPVTNINGSVAPVGDYQLQQNSKIVSSNQTGLHPRLASTVLRHLDTDFRRPVAAHSMAAYRSITVELARNPRPLVLDSFCGTGMSSALLARRHPHHLVIGVDQSAHRLARHERTVTGVDYLLLQANCEDIWQLLLADGLSVDFHYLLYPNPWPKSKHLQRRIHGHASFPRLLALGGTLELRSNWQIYVEEFGTAMHLAGRYGLVARVPEGPALTLFEQKYRRSGHPLWRYCSAGIP